MQSAQFNHDFVSYVQASENVLQPIRRARSADQEALTVETIVNEEKKDSSSQSSNDSFQVD